MTRGPYPGALEARGYRLPGRGRYTRHTGARGPTLRTLAPVALAAGLGLRAAAPVADVEHDRAIVVLANTLAGLAA